MSKTQLASMFIGEPYTAETDIPSKQTPPPIIHILDGQENLIFDFITENDIIDDTHRKSLEDTLETYNFITFADKSFAEFLEKRNRIIIPDEDGNLIEFIIFEAHKYRDTEGYKAQVFSHASYLELKKAKVIYPGKRERLVAAQHANLALELTGWELGAVEAKGIRTIDIDKHTSPYHYLKKIASEFSLELRFRVEHDGNKITGRYVDLLERIGEWSGREVEFGKDLDGIRRIEKQDVVTALLGLGPEREDGTRLEVLVEDADALQRWGRIDERGNIKHLIEPYEIQSERSEMTETEARQYTRTALDKRINTQISYECSIVDLENVHGMQNKKIRIGDTIKIKDTKFNPPLYLEARVFEQSRSIKNKAKKDIKLGDYIEYTEEEVTKTLKRLEQQIKKRITHNDMSEFTYAKSVIDDKDLPGIEAKSKIDVDVGTNVIETTSGAINKANTAENNAKTYAQQIVEQTSQELEQALGVLENSRITIEQAQSLIDDTIENPHNYQGEFVGDLIADSLIVRGPIISQDATITGTIQASDATFMQATIEQANIIDANVENATITGTLDGVDGTFNGDLVGANILGSSLISYDTETNNVITLDGGVITTYENGEVTSFITADGHYFFRDNKYIGRIGTARLVSDPNYHGLVFSLNNDLDFMAWAYRYEPSGTPLTIFSWHRDDTHDYQGFRMIHTLTVDEDIRTFSNVFAEGIVKATRFENDLGQVAYMNNSNKNLVVGGDLYVHGEVTSLLRVLNNVSTTGAVMVGDQKARLAYVDGNAYIQVDGTEVRVTKYLSTAYMPIRASSFPTGSLAEYKTDIKPFSKSALDIITSSTIYDYKLKTETDAEDVKRRTGLVIGEGYKTPKEVIDGDGVELYAMGSIAWKGIQELNEKLERMVKSLKDENMKLKNEITNIRERWESSWKK